ncbi:MAG: hypothetical protein KKC68_04270 [Candidatus Thermoplasmatota archaeon]|nr:hypothetical protein [Candidatus Thermoplasmatota archaeon]MBU1940966.1 hypothetical protein [Candidatus Thermoplasmatota archaeon]
MSSQRIHHILFLTLLFCLIVPYTTTAFSPALYQIGELLDTAYPITSDPSNEYEFTPQDMTLADDAFHGSDDFSYTEWWYFDAAFDNGYTAQCSIRIVSAFNQGVIFSRFDLYYKGDLIEHTQERYLLQHLTASNSIPNVQLNGKQIISARVNQDTGAWIYTLSFDHGTLAADLTYTGITKGWKGQLKGGDWWAVALPRATVEGTITYQNNKIECTGIGYHDHNWEVKAFAGLNFGWVWGKIHANQHTITWSNIYTTRFLGQPILVLNEENNGYINIHEDNIQFIANDFTFDQSRFIPHKFTIIASQNDIYINIDLEVLETHHTRIYGFLHYWRYHVHSTGTIIHGPHTEILDDIHIAEIIRFR